MKKLIMYDIFNVIRRIVTYHWVLRTILRMTLKMF